MDRSLVMHAKGGFVGGVGALAATGEATNLEAVAATWDLSALKGAPERKLPYEPSPPMYFCSTVGLEDGAGGCCCCMLHSGAGGW
jgi:hypothetical protein